MEDFIEDFTENLIRSGLAFKSDIRACSNREVEFLENKFQIRLPIIYKAFLLKMGHRAGRFCQGTDIFYEGVLTNREALEEVLQSDGYPFELRQTMFVFSCHQGYIFHFFNIEDSLLDPPVYGYEEESLKLVKTNESFSSFLLAVFEEEKRVCNL